MIRAVGFLLLLAALTWGAVQLAENPGHVAITWQGYRINFSVGVLLLLVAAIAVLWATLSRVWRWLHRGPGRFMENRASRRREQGYRLLTQGLVAAAAGDAKAAHQIGAKAGQLVQTPLNLLLLAQAAQLKGDEAAARRYFEAMLEHKETEFLGLRGLIVQATKVGDWETARRHARHAYGLRPETEWLSSVLFDLEGRAGDWRAAQKTLEAATRAKLVDPHDAPHRRAVVLAERARTAHLGGAGEDSPQDALALAREAHKFDPGLIAATALAAGLLAAQGKARAATKMVEAGWKCGPHPDLARAYTAIAPDEPALERTRRFEKLHALNPDHPESRIALAEAALEAELWGEARRHLEAAATERPTQRVYRLLAALEERQGADALDASGDGSGTVNEAAMRQWLRRAASAAPGAAWLCSKCGAASDQWRARCGACDAFDSLDWKLPATMQPEALPEDIKTLAPAVDAALAQE
ncbi:MAG: heme biosynthesis HemY N-terminal domain-containing protein [Alphaproteobacteria bacterium]